MMTILVPLLFSIWPGTVILAYGVGWNRGFRHCDRMEREHQARMDRLFPRFPRFPRFKGGP